MSQQHSWKRVLKISSDPPEQPPLRVPAGGGALNTSYPDYDVASEDKWRYDWDEKTRRLVLERVHNVPPYRFFDEAEARLLEALCERALPQPDRQASDKVPIAPRIDERLHKGEGQGYRYDSMPDDGTAYRHGLQGVDQAARDLFGESFARLAPHQQDRVMERVAQGEAPGEVWQRLPAKRFFSMLVNDVITNYYAHPRAWAEIGFNGLASPSTWMSKGMHAA